MAMAGAFWDSGAAFFVNADDKALDHLLTNRLDPRPSIVDLGGGLVSLCLCFWKAG